MRTVASFGRSAGTAITPAPAGAEPAAASLQAEYSRIVPSGDHQTASGYQCHSSEPLVTGGAMVLSVPSATFTRTTSCASPRPGMRRW